MRLPKNLWFYVRGTKACCLDDTVPHIRSHIWGAVSAIWMVPRSEVFDCTEHTLRLIVLGETAGPDPPVLHIVLPPQPHAASTRRHALGCMSVLYGG